MAKQMIKQHPIIVDLIAKKSKRISCGEILTLNLKNRIRKEAYCLGGLFIKGDIVKKSINNMTARTTIYLQKIHIIGDAKIFLRDFNKTMNSKIYEIELL